MKTFGFAAIAAIAALILGFGSQLTASTPAQADGTALVVVGCETLVSVGVTAPNAVTAAEACATPGTLTPAQIVKIAHNLHKDATVSATNDKLSASDLAAKATLTANQITSPTVVGNDLIAFLFVNNEAKVVFDAPSGLTFNPNDGGTANDWTCDTNAEDADCDASIANDGDGVVTARIQIPASGAAAPNTTPVVNVTQGTGATLSATINVMGAQHDVVLTLTKSTVQSQSSTNFTACKSGADVTDSSVLSNPTEGIAIATVTDASGAKLTRVPVTLTSSATSTADKAVGDGTFTSPVGNTFESVDGGTAGIAYFAVVCGGTATGTADLTASINTAGTATVQDTDKKTVTVTGAPSAIALTASPAAVICDGNNSSSVTAKVTDSSGNNVADGTSVTFSVVALGTANPINVKTTAGSASSTITPLSVATAGVTVNVSSGDAAASIRVDCTPTGVVGATTPAAVPTAPSGTITGPNTGTGGYLGQNSSTSFPMWTLIALALGSFALIGGGLVVRRSGK